MPLYEFRCPACTATSEYLLAVADRARPIECDCGTELVRRVGRISLGGVTVAPEPRSHLPSSMRGVGFSRERIAEVQRAEERLSKFEERNTGFTPERMPVVNHEGPAGLVRSSGRISGTAATS